MTESFVPQPHNFEEDVRKVSSITLVPTILDVVCRITGMGFAAVARVTDQHWVACAVRDDIQFGLTPGAHLELQTTICDEIRRSGMKVVIDHVAEDNEFCNHHTPARYGFQSYISIPIILRDGSFFGTLCAIDPRPARLKRPEIINMFELFAELLSLHISMSDQLAVVEEKLFEERLNSNLRDQFIAVLGHDLRNPVGAVSASAQLLLRMPLEDDAHKLASIIHKSSYRMSGLIENVLDFAHGHLGGGINLHPKIEYNLNDTLEQVINEIQVMLPDQKIVFHTDLKEAIYCDAKRIAQLFSNLLSNAATYGSAGEPIEVLALSNGGRFILTVKNTGQPIPDDVMPLLFQPFTRGEESTNKEGLGLGLYIASEIAKAHGGLIQAVSKHGFTSFSVNIPSGN
jgi:signal transduction histidine kinase